MTVIHRFAARGILLTPDNEVLLMKLQNPDTRHEFWITPGGGIEEGEDPISALRRELSEELGLTDFVVGAHVWTRGHRFTWESREINQHESFFIINVSKFIPTSIHMTEGPERRAFQTFNWWNLDALEASKEVFAPKNIGELLRIFLSDGAPNAPVSVGI